MSDPDVSAALHASRFLGDLPPPWRQAMRARARELQVPGGTQLCRTGTPATRLILVVRGEVALMRELHGHEQDELLGQATAGTLFGALAANGGPGDSPLTVTALGEVLALAWELADIAALSADHPGLAHQLAHRLSLWRREDELLRLMRTAEYFHGLSPLLLRAAVRTATLLPVPAASLVFEQDAASDSFFLVVDGQLDVIVRDHASDTPAASCFSGDCLGELTMLQGGRRRASVLATRDSVVLRFPREAFRYLWQESRAFQHNVVSLSAERSRARGAATARVHVLVDHATRDEGTIARLLADELRATFGEGTAVLDVDGLAQDELARRIHEARARPEIRHVVCHARGLDDRPQLLETLRREGALITVLTDDADRPLTWAARDRLRVVEVHGRHDAERPWRASRAGTSRVHWELATGDRRTRVELDDRSRDGLARLARAMTGRTVGVALSGGAAWGFAHLALLRGMHRANIPIDVVAGVSFGSVVGAAYASLQLDGLARLEASANRRMNVRAFGAMFTTWAVGSWVRWHLPHRRLEQLPVRYVPVAVDIRTGRERRFRHGDLAEAVRSSCSLPGVFATTLYEGTRYVDGCVRSNVPVEALREEGADLVVASNIIPAPPALDSEPPRNAFTRALSEMSPLARMASTWRALFLMFNVAGDQEATSADVTFCPDLTMFSPTNFARGAAIAAHAEAQIEPVIVQLQDAFRGLGDARPGIALVPTLDETNA